MLKGKKIVVAVSGGIAAYKALDLVSTLRKLEADVRVVMTKEAQEFVGVVSFQSLSKNKVIVTLFEEYENSFNPHISLQDADILVVVPATANVIAKIANGIADDALTTTVLSTKAKKIICPAMNSQMYINSITQENLNKLRNHGFTIIEPGCGLLACNCIGVGRLATTKEIVAVIKRELRQQDYKGKKIMITLGGTREKIDAVRVITNTSSGKMGMALAMEAYERGADVVLLKGSVTVDVPTYFRVIDVESTNDMCKEALANSDNVDMFIMAAAPCDYKVLNTNNKKIKDADFTLACVKTVDIAAEIGKIKKDNQKLVIFAAEVENVLDYALEKLNRKNADMVVANDVSIEGSGFNSDTNIADIIKRDSSVLKLEKMPKKDLAKIILDEALGL